MILEIRRTETWHVPGLVGRMKGAIEDSDLSTTSICRQAGVSTAVWYELKSGAKKTIKFETIVALCNVLQLEIPELEERGHFLCVNSVRTGEVDVF